MSLPTYLWLYHRKISDFIHWRVPVQIFCFQGKNYFNLICLVFLLDQMQRLEPVKTTKSSWRCIRIDLEETLLAQPQQSSNKDLLIKNLTKISFFHQCSKMQIIPIKKFNIQTCFFQFLWFFRLVTALMKETYFRPSDAGSMRLYYRLSDFKL